jgi:hypothetical protein
MDPAPDDADVDAHVDESPPPDAGPQGSVTLRFEPDADTTIRSDAPTTNDGPLDFLEIDADPPKIALMYFDISAIPPGATVLAAHLEAVMIDPFETGTMQVFPLTESWTEDGATFIEREPGVLWTSPGAGELSSDRATLLGEITPDTIAPIVVPLDVARVQAWVESPDQNFGISFISTSADGRGGQMNSREWIVADERPVLQVVYRE